MKRLLNVLLFFPLLIQCISYQDQQTLSNKPVYSSFQIIEASLNSICQSKKLTNIISLSGNSKDLFYAFSDVCGLVLSRLTIDGGYQLIKSYPEINNMLSIKYHPYSNTLWIVDLTNTIFIYDISIPTSINRINSIACTSPTQRIQFSDDDKQVFLLQNQGIIQVYNIEGGKITFLQSFTNQNNPKSILVSPNRKVLIIGGFNLFFYKINNINYDPAIAYDLSNYQQIVSSDDTPEIYLVQDKYLFTWSQRTGLNQYDISLCLQTQVCDKNSVILQFTQKNQGLGFGFLFFTSDRNFFVTFLNFFGIYVFDVQARNGFKLYQTIDLVGLTTAMAFNQDESLIMMTLNNQFNVYQKIQSNLNIDAPNILNIHQNYLFSKHVGAIKTTWHCLVDGNETLIVNQGSGGSSFININPINKSLTIANHVDIKSDSNVIDEVRVLNDPQYVVVSAGAGGLFFYKKSSDYSTMTLVSTYYPPMPNADMDSIKQTKDSTTLFIGSGYVGLIVVDISDITNPKHVTAVYYTFDKQPFTSAENVWISDDQKVLYCSYRYLGVVIYDISDFHNPKQLNVLYTQGGEDMVLTKDEKHMVVIDTIYGYNIYSLEKDRTKPVWVSSVQTMGYAAHMRFVQNDNYILTTSIYRGQLFLIDFRDRNAPKLIQSYQYQGIDQGSADVCVSKDESFCFITYSSGVVQIPLRNPVIFHTDIIWMKEEVNSSKKKQVLMNPTGSSTKSQNLLVGMNVSLQLSQIYKVNAVILLNAYYYDNQEMKALPWWITLSQKSLSATIQVNKDALDQIEIQNLVNSKTKGTDINSLIVEKQKQIFFKLSERVSTTDFIESSVGIDATLSIKIFNDCQAQQIIQDSGFINDGYSINQISVSLTNPAYTDPILEQIKFILRSKITYYPVVFQIQNSLFIDIYSKTKIINSFSNTLSVYFKVDATTAQFINKNYPGVLTSFSDKYDEIKIEGDQNSVNQILLNGVKTANLTTINLIQVRMVVNDGVNYDLYKDFTCDQTQILSLNSPTYLNPLLSLQNDFNHKFSKGEIAILEKFQYQMSSEVFLDNDSSDIQIQAFILNSDGEYAPISHDFWMSFDQSQKSFSGTPPSNEYNNILHLKVIATDGYTQVEDLLKISISNIPLSYVLTILFQILGPIFGLLGLWKYSSTIYNILNKKKHETSLFQAKAGEVILIQIPLIKDEMELAKQLWTKYYSQLQKSELLLALRYYKEKYPKIVLEQKIQKPVSINFGQKGSEINFQLDNQCDISPAIANKNNSQFNIKPQQMLLGAQNSTDIIYQSPSPLLNPQQVSIYHQEQLSPKKEQNQSIQVLNTGRVARVKDESNQVNRIQKQLKNYEKKQMKQSQLISNKNTQSQNRIKDKCENTFFNSAGHLNRDFILSQVLVCYTSFNKAKQNEGIIQNLQDPHSKLSHCVIGLAAIQLAQFDESTNKIIEYLKSKAIQNYTPLDWYKEYVYIYPHFELVQTKPFPSIEINEQSLNDALKVFQQNTKDEKTESSAKFYIPLVKDYLVAAAYGFTFDSHFLIPRPNGECLQMRAHSLKCIESYIPVTNTACLGLRKMFDLEFVQKELIDNSKLNSWIEQVDISNNVILIKGTPQNKDIGRYLFKIKDFLGYTIKRINIQVQYNSELASKYAQEKHLKEQLRKNSIDQSFIQEQLVPSEGQSQERLDIIYSQYNNTAHRNSQNLHTNFYTTNQDELLV